MIYAFDKRTNITKLTLLYWHAHHTIEYYLRTSYIYLYPFLGAGPTLKSYPHYDAKRLKGQKKKYTDKRKVCSERQ